MLRYINCYRFKQYNYLLHFVCPNPLICFIITIICAQTTVVFEQLSCSNNFRANRRKSDTSVHCSCKIITSQILYPTVWFRNSNKIHSRRIKIKSVRERNAFPFGLHFKIAFYAKRIPQPVDRLKATADFRKYLLTRLFAFRPQMILPLWKLIRERFFFPDTSCAFENFFLKIKRNSFRFEVLFRFVFTYLFIYSFYFIRHTAFSKVHSTARRSNRNGWINRTRRPTGCYRFRGGAKAHTGLTDRVRGRFFCGPCFFFSEALLA